MSDESKIFLALMAIFVVGVALISIGLGVTTKTAMIAVGVIIVLTTVKAMAAIWKGRP